MSRGREGGLDEVLGVKEGRWDRVGLAVYYRRTEEARD